MIEWQGAPPMAERLGPVSRIYARCLMGSAAMLACISILNIGSWAIWKAEADVMLYPLFGAWLFFYLLLLQVALAPRPFGPGLPALFGLALSNLPLAFLSILILQSPLLFAQVAVSKLITSAFA